MKEKDVLEYLKKLKEEYKVGGIWIAKKMGRRISFYVGFEPEILEPPENFEINNEFLLFCEDPSRIKKNIKKILNDLRILLDKGG